MLPILAGAAGILGAAHLKHKMDIKEKEGLAEQAQSQAAQIEAMSKEAAKAKAAQILKKWKAEAALNQKVEEKGNK